MLEPPPVSCSLVEPGAGIVGTAVKTAVLSTVSTTVDATRVSVVTNVLLAVAGQLTTVNGQAVTVAVRVVKTVEVIISIDSPTG